MKVLIVYHFVDRELLICKLIEQRINAEYPEVETKISSSTDCLMVSTTYKPDVILTPPVRDETVVPRMAAIKILYGTKIVSLTTEGVENFDNSNVIDARIGNVDYGKNIIDYYFYWGDKPTKIFRDALLKKGLVASGDRVGVCGYCMYEKNAIANAVKENHIYKEIKEMCEEYGKAILFVTSFYIFDDIIEDRKACSTFPEYSSEEEYEEHVKKLRQLEHINDEYAKQYVRNIIAIAEKYPRKAIIVKMHPVELEKFKKGKDPYYADLYNYSNIMVIKEAYPIGAIFPYVESLFHYGSTTGLEAYIYGVPSILLTMNSDETFDEKYGYLFGDVYFDSSINIRVDNIDKIFDVIDNGVPSRKLEKTEKYLKDVFNFANGEEYIPTYVIAKELVEGCPSLKTSKADEKTMDILKSKKALFVRIVYYKRYLAALKRRDREAMKYEYECIKKLLPSVFYLIEDLLRQTYISIFKRAEKG